MQFQIGFALLVGWLAVAYEDLIETHNGAVTALATIAIAWFTLTLKLSTDKLWKAGRDTFEASERAFVFLDGFEVELTVATDAKEVRLENLPDAYKDCPELYITRFAIFPKWKNGGNTPTRNMCIQVGWGGGLPGTVLPKFESGGQLFFLPPRSTQLGEVIEIPSARSLVDWSMNPIGAAPIILVWGRAEYDDVFGNGHFIEWCYQLRLGRPDKERMRAQFIQWGEYNQTDETGWQDRPRPPVPRPSAVADLSA